MGFDTWYLRGLAIDYYVVGVLLGYTRLRHHAAIFGSWLDLIICNNGVLSVELMFIKAKFSPWVALRTCILSDCHSIASTKVMHLGQLQEDFGPSRLLSSRIESGCILASYHSILK